MALVVVAVVSGSVSAVPAAGPAGASSPVPAVPAGLVAFARQDAAGSSIWVSERDGSNPRRLTSGADDTGPMWSPTGTQLMFTRATTYTASYDTWSGDADGSGHVEAHTEPNARTSDVWIFDIRTGTERQFISSRSCAFPAPPAGVPYLSSDVRMSASAVAWAADGRSVTVRWDRGSVGGPSCNKTDPLPWAGFTLSAAGLPVLALEQTGVAVRNWYENGDAEWTRVPDPLSLGCPDGSTVFYPGAHVVPGLGLVNPVTQSWPTNVVTKPDLVTGEVGYTASVPCGGLTNVVSSPAVGPDADSSPSVNRRIALTWPAGTNGTGSALLDWSPDGSRIMVNGPDHALWTAPAGGGLAVEATPRYPGTSIYDGRRVLDTANNCYLLGGSSTPGSTTYRPRSADWSSDGTVVVEESDASVAFTLPGFPAPDPVPGGHWCSAGGYAKGLVVTDVATGRTSALIGPSAGASLVSPDIQCQAASCLTLLRIELHDPNAADIGHSFTFSGAVPGSTTPQDPFGLGGYIQGRVPPGSPTVAMDPVAGRSVASISCDRPATANPGQGKVTVPMAAGDITTCTFTIAATELPPGNSAPSAHDDDFTIARNGIREFGTPLDVVANDVDLDEDALHVVSPLGNPTHGNLYLLADGRIGYQYFRTQSYLGDDTFTYWISDGHGHVASATVTVHIVPGKPKCVVLASGIDPCLVQPGDILLVHHTDFISRVDLGLGATWWSHAAIVTSVDDRDHDGRPDIYFAEATPGDQPEVHISPIEGSEWDSEKHVPVTVIRVLAPAAKVTAAAAFAKAEAGRGLHYTINPFRGRGRNAYYCSGFVWRAFHEQGVEVDGGRFFGPSLTGIPSRFVTPDDLAEMAHGALKYPVVPKTEGGSGAIALAADSAHLMLTDPSGRRVGIGADGVEHEEVPGANLVRSITGENVRASGLNGLWQVTVSGTGTGGYELDAHEAGDLSSAAGRRSGTTTNGSTATFTIGSLGISHPPVPILSMGRGPAGSPIRTVHLDGSASTDPDNTIASYGWDFDGDGTVDQTTNQPTVDHTYALPASDLTPALQVTDSGGAVGSTAGVTLQVDAATGEFRPTLRLMSDQSSGAVPLTTHLQVTGFAVDEVASWNWDFGDGTTAQTTTPDVAHTFATTGPGDVEVSDAAHPDRYANARVEGLAAGPPAAADDTTTADQGRSTNIDVLANDNDPDRDLDATSLEVTQAPTHGTAAVDQAIAAIAYTPQPGFAGSDTLTYEVCDHAGHCDTASVTISVVAFTGPTARPDAYTVTGGRATTVAASGVLGNDTDPTPGDTLDAIPVLDPVHGSLDLRADGSFTYTPDAGFTGADHFRYVTFDATDRTSDPVVVSLQVTPAAPIGFTITNAGLPGGKVGTAYAVSLTTVNGLAPLKWKKIGKLPKGLKLNATTGRITGVPKQRGSSTFTVQATYKTKVPKHPAVKIVASRAFTITVI
ncbi:MAG: Ig-like domain-containing protein [Acidimicrobiia bacterium]